MTAFIALSLLGLEVNLDAQRGADGQIIDGAMDVFVGRHAVMAMGASHSPPPITMNVELDNFRRKCYLIDDESYETEEFVKTYYFQDAILEIRRQ
jgi:hypothetical protein